MNSAAENSPLTINKQVEPLLDDYLIAERTDVEFKLHDPERKEIVFCFDQPWERGSGYATFLRDHEGRIRLYYRAEAAGGDLSDQQTSALAFSDDGVHFERPTFGLVEDQGSNRNNMIWRGVEGHNMAPFLDTNPDAAEYARYKATAGPMWKLYGLQSADGIHWTRVQEKPLDMEGAFDSHNVVFWDQTIGCYRCFSRYFEGGWPEGIRAIQSATSTDFIKWSNPVPHQYEPYRPLEQFYTNATIPYPGHDRLLLSFPMRITLERRVVVENRHKGVCDALFMTSRDGVRWERRFPDAWLRPGSDYFNWTDRSNSIAHGLIVTEDQQWSLYTVEHNRRPDRRLRRITVRPHGFVSLHAGYRQGSFTTKPLIINGRELHVNFATSAAGEVSVEIQEPGEKPIPGYAAKDMEPLYGDSQDRLVCWREKHNLSALNGRVVQMKFVLREADVYSLQIT